MKHVLRIAILMVIALVISSCSAPSQLSSSAPNQINTAPAAPLPQVQQQEQQPDNPPVAMEFLAPSNTKGKQLQYSLAVQIETTTFMDGIRTLMELLKTADGYVKSADITGRSLHENPDRLSERYAQYELNIPTENLSAFLYAIEDQYNLVRLVQNAQDVTAQHTVDTANLDALKKEKKQLEEALTAAETTEEKLEYQNRLTQIDSEIASLTATTNTTQDAVIYSSVTITLSEVVQQAPEPELSFTQKLRSAGQGAILNLIAFAQGFLLVLLNILPALIILGILLFFVLTLRKNKLVSKLMEAVKKDLAAPQADTDNNVFQTHEKPSESAEPKKQPQQPPNTKK